MVWTPQQKAFCVSQYIATGSYLEAQRRCVAEFNLGFIRNAPDKMSIQR